jgi:hypothetical protein
MEDTEQVDREIAAMQKIVQALHPLAPEDRDRVVIAAAVMFGLDDLAAALLSARRAKR